VQFEWDAVKAATNLAKHGVSFDEASTVFGDRLARTDPDEQHSEDEDRFLTIGVSFVGRVLVVWHTSRTGAVRIIGARPATASERRAYESGE
jgi:uncharacterized DUF497 family protein